MKGYFVKVGDKEIGPFRSANAAKAEAQELRKEDHDAKVVSRNVPESVWIEHLGNAEREIEDDDDSEIDWDAIFKDDEDDDDDDDDKDDDGDEDEDEDDEDEDDDDDDDDEKKPGGQHFFFRERGSK